MLYSFHVIDPKRTLTNADIGGGNYPITLTLEQFLDLFNFVKAIDVSLFTYSTELGNLPSNIQESIEAGNNNPQIYSFSGRLQRTIRPVGLLNTDGTELANPPTAQVDYPFFSGGRNGALIQIDLGKTKFLNGVFYPYMDIITSTGADLGSSRAIGVVNFEGYGSFALRSNNSIVGGGSMRVSERYDSLVLPRLTVSPHDNIVVTSNASLTNLERYTIGYIGNKKVTVTATANTLSLTLPEEVKSGPIRFETDGATEFDSFRTMFELSTSL